MAFTPTLFIDIGEHQHFFTLRETYLHTVHIPGEGPNGNAVVNGVYQGTTQTEVRSFHHQNLSQDGDEAYTKAVALAAELGLALTTQPGEMAFKLAEIQRATAAELAAREAYYQLMREEREATKREKIAQGVYPVGRWTDRAFKAPECLGYTRWVGLNVDKFEAGSIMRDIADAIITQCPELLTPDFDQRAYVGTIGQRLTLDVEVVRVFSFTRPSFSGWGQETVWIVSMRGPQRECIVSKSASFRAEVGEKFRMKATVKDHDDYKGQAQTIVQRINVIEEK